MSDVIDPYVNSRLIIYRKLKAQADALVAKKRAEMATTGSATVTKDDLNTLVVPHQVVNEIAFGLDEAVAALNFYAAPSTWAAVPEKTLAADDLGTKAKVALARINPV